MKSLIDSAVILTFLTILVYLLGLFYLGSYLSEIGLRFSLFKVSNMQILINAIDASFEAMHLSVLFAMSIATLSLTLLSDIKKGFNWLLLKLFRIKTDIQGANKTEIDKKDPETQKFYTKIKIIFKFAGFLFASLIFSLFLKDQMSQGVLDAQEAKLERKIIVLKEDKGIKNEYIYYGKYGDKYALQRLTEDHAIALSDKNIVEEYFKVSIKEQ